MFDPKEPVRARRAIAVRDLARSAGSLINEIERDESVFVVSRYGRMVAVLAPLPERTIVEVCGQPEPSSHLPRYGDLPEADSEPEPEWLDLSPLGQEILLDALDAAPMPFILNDHAARHGARETGIEYSGLELGGYVETNERGRRLTERGLAAAGWIQGSLDRPEAPPPS